MPTETGEINVIVRVMPNADDVDVSLPLNATPLDIIEEMLSANLGIPRVDQQGNPISYKLNVKGRNDTLKEYETLASAQVQDSDIILMMPQVKAG